MHWKYIPALISSLHTHILRPYLWAANKSNSVWFPIDVLVPDPVSHYCSNRPLDCRSMRAERIQNENIEIGLIDGDQDYCEGEIYLDWRHSSSRWRVTKGLEYNVPELLNYSDDFQMMRNSLINKTSSVLLFVSVWFCFSAIDRVSNRFTANCSHNRNLNV